MLTSFANATLTLEAPVIVNFMRKRPQLDWDEVRQIVAGLANELNLPLVKVPGNPADSLQWIDGIGVATFSERFLLETGWQVDSSGSFLPRPITKAHSGSKVLRVVRGFSKLSLATATSRFYGSKSRPYDTTERSVKLMAEILDSDDLLSERFGIASAIGLALVEDDPEKELSSLDPGVLAKWLEGLNLRLEEIGYETLWVRAYKDFG